MADKHRKDKVVSIDLTMTDLSILVWGFDAVSWSDADNEAEWKAATEKILKAYRKEIGYD